MWPPELRAPTQGRPYGLQEEPESSLEYPEMPENPDSSVRVLRVSVVKQDVLPLLELKQPCFSARLGGRFYML